MIAHLEAGTAGPTVLGEEAARIKALDSPSATLAEDQQRSARTAAMIIAEAATSLVAQANYSGREVSELLTFMPSTPAPRAD